MGLSSANSKRWAFIFRPNGLSFPPKRRDPSACFFLIPLPKIPLPTLRAGTRHDVGGSPHGNFSLPRTSTATKPAQDLARPPRRHSMIISPVTNLKVFGGWAEEFWAEELMCFSAV